MILHDNCITCFYHSIGFIGKEWKLLDVIDSNMDWKTGNKINTEINVIINFFYINRLMYIGAIESDASTRNVAQCLDTHFFCSYRYI